MHFIIKGTTKHGMFSASFDMLEQAFKAYAEYIADPNVLTIELVNSNVAQPMAIIDKTKELPYDDHTVIYNIIG